MGRLHLEPIGTSTENIGGQPITIMYRVTGATPEDLIQIDRLGVAHPKWCVVWYRQERGTSTRMPAPDQLFDTVESALEALQSTYSSLEL
jgi:hypothetical protein